MQGFQRLPKFMKNRLNYYWRNIASVFCFGLFGIGSCLVSVVFLLVVRLLPVHQSTKHRWLLASISRLSALYINIMQWLGLMTYTQQGPALSSFSGHLIIANHPTLVDALFFIAANQNLCCIVKTDLLKNPFTRYIVKLAGYIPNRSETLLTDAAKALAAGKNLLVFPEGTRNTYDDQLDFKRGAANIALAAGCPIVPVVFSCHPRALQKGAKWYDFPDTAPKVVFKSYPPLDCRDYINENSPITMQARQLTSGLVEFFRQEITGEKGQRPCPYNTTSVEHPASQAQTRQGDTSPRRI